MLIVHVLSPGDRKPEYSGGRMLEDAESGACLNLRITPSLASAYTARVTHMTQALERACRRTGTGFVSLRTEDGLEGAVQALIREGFLEPS
jgi:uncharacterized protein (DUF58 family)